MEKENRNEILHILKGIACRGTVNGDIFKVRQADLDRIWEIVAKDKGERRNGSI